MVKTMGDSCDGDSCDDGDYTVLRIKQYTAGTQYAVPPTQ